MFVVNLLLLPAVGHQIFHDLPDLLNAGDLLVVNDSKVLPARLVGEKAGTGAVSEILLLRQVKGDVWECLAKPGKRLKAGTEVVFGDGSLRAVIRETMEDGNKLVEFFYDTQTLYEKLDEFGKMPLPPYITRQLEDQSQYQTVYAKYDGSAAAPQAGSPGTADPQWQLWVHALHPLAMPVPKGGEVRHLTRRIRRNGGTSRPPFSADNKKAASLSKKDTATARGVLPRELHPPKARGGLVCAIRRQVF